MLLLTLWEPWATLMAIGAKKIETRDWFTGYRGPVAIHAAKGGLGKAELKSCCTEKFFPEALKNLLNPHSLIEPERRHVPAFHFGHILAVGNLVECLPTETIRCLPGVFDDFPELDTPEERAFGDYGKGRYGLVFENMRRLKRPVAFKSRQGKLLPMDGDTLRLVQEQLEN